MYPSQPAGTYPAGPYGHMYGYNPQAGEGSQPRGRQEREAAPVKFTEGKLFIGGVEPNIISKDELVEYCSQWGRVADAVVMDHKGYGFVTFANPKDAMTFLEARVHELKRRRLDAKAAVPKAHLGTAKLTKKMFVGGTGDLTDDDFREHFAQYGEIEDAAVLRRDGQSRGFGFVTFRDEISVEKCLLVNHFIKGRKVELKRAVPKDEVYPGQQAMPPGAFPHGPYSPQPGMQPYYPMPYGPGPYGMVAPRPGFPPAAAPHGAMHMPGDPYGWYGMGYMPYYHPAAAAAGMYPAPYGMMPQPGMAPYMGPAVPYMHPGAGGAAAAQLPGGPPRGTMRQQQQQQGGAAGGGASSSGAAGGAADGGGSSSTGGGGGMRGGSSRGGRSSRGGSSSAAEAAAAAAAAAAVGGAGPSAAAAGGDPARPSSSSTSSQGPPGLPPSLSTTPAASPAAPSSRQPAVVTTFPSTGVRVAGGPGQQRPVGPGLMPFAAAGLPPGIVVPGGSLPQGYVAVPRGPPQQQQQHQQHQQQQQQPPQQQQQQPPARGGSRSPQQ